MKFLENYELNKFNSRLDDGIDAGSMVLFGKLELYSCKKAKTDKILTKELKEKINKVDNNKLFENEIKKNLMPIKQTHPVLSPTSPFGVGSSSPNFSRLEPSSGTIIELISALNHLFPDYDFKDTKSTDFQKCHKIELVINSINLALREVITTDERNKIWSQIDAEMDLKSCNAYEYTPDEYTDPISRSGRLWSWNYIFFNKKLKKILYFGCNARCKEYLKYSAGSTSDTDSDPESFYSNPKNQSVHYYPRGQDDFEDSMEMSEF